MGRDLIIATAFGLWLLAGSASGQEADHPSVDLGPVRLEFKARVEADLHSATPEAGRDHADWVWQNPRVEIGGAVGRRVEFELSREFGHGERDDAEWKDAFVNLRIARSLEISAGRFKVPFGREALVARANLDFINRSLGSNHLAPSRDTGLMVHGRVLGSRVEYEAGYFDGDGDNARTEQAAGADDTIAGRLVIRPFHRSKTPASSLQLGVALARSHVEDRLSLRGQTLLEDGDFFDRLYVNGRRLRAGLEAFWTAGPVSIAGEYMTVSDQRLGMGFHHDDLPPLDARAWHIAGTWALTGEKKDGRLEPRRWMGAVELVGRIEELRFDEAAHPGTAFGFPTASALQANSDLVNTIGVNWSFTRFFRIQYNLAIEKIADRQRSPAPTNDGRLTSSLLRVQLTI